MTILSARSRQWPTIPPPPACKAGGDALHVERAEVDRFLDAGEYGLALDTLSWILVEEAKPISSDTLREIESLADAMDLAGDPFLDAVRNARKRQTASWDQALRS